MFLRFLHKLILKVLGLPLRVILFCLNCSIIWRNGAAVGEQVLMTGAVSRYSKIKPHSRIIIITRYPEFFINNPQIFLVIGEGLWPIWLRVFVTSYLRASSGPRICEFLFQSQYGLANYMKNTGSTEHLASLHFSNFVVSEELNPNFEAVFFITQDEFEHVKRKYNLPDEYCVINTETKMTYAPVKAWSKKKFSKVVMNTKELSWIMVDEKKNFAKAENLTNLSGLTSLRELIVIVSQSRLCLGTEGFLGHVASAFSSVHSVVILSGFSTREYIQHKNTKFIAASPKPICSPCWLTSECEKKKQYCMTRITAKQVEEVVLKLSRI